MKPSYRLLILTVIKFDDMSDFQTEPKPEIAKPNKDGIELQGLVVSEDSVDSKFRKVMKI